MGCPGWFSLSKRIFTETDFYDDNSSLADLVVSGGVLPPGRGVRIQCYRILSGAVPGLSSVTFTASDSVDGQRLQYQWNGVGGFIEIAPDTQSPPLTLNGSPGDPDSDNTLEVRVTAPDKLTETTYTVKFSKGGYTLIYDGNGETCRRPACRRGTLHSGTARDGDGEYRRTR